jgi:hypothetical protein
MRNIYTTRRSRHTLRPLPAHIHRQFVPIRIHDKTVPPLLGDHMDESGNITKVQELATRVRESVQ